MTVATEAWFAGAWTLARVVRAPDGAVLARLAGTAAFRPDDAGLRLVERGTLATPRGRFSAERETLWRFGPGGRIAIAFADGRPFHAFSADAPRAVHPCGEDVYRVRYRFAGAAWAARWRVEGPAKDWVIVSLYRRAAAPQPTTESAGAFSSRAPWMR